MSGCGRTGGLAAAGRRSRAGCLGGSMQALSRYPMIALPPYPTNGVG